MELGSVLVLAEWLAGWLVVFDSPAIKICVDLIHFKRYLKKRKLSYKGVIIF